MLLEHLAEGDRATDIWFDTGGSGWRRGRRGAEDTVQHPSAAHDGGGVIPVGGDLEDAGVGE